MSCSNCRGSEGNQGGITFSIGFFFAAIQVEMLSAYTRYLRAKGSIVHKGYVRDTRAVKSAS